MFYRIKQLSRCFKLERLLIIIYTHAREAIGSASACADCLDNTLHGHSA